MNDKELDHEGIGSVTDHIITNKSFLNSSVNLWEIHNSSESIYQKRKRQDQLG